MAKNQIVTPYDDAGFPAVASSAVSITNAGGVVKAGAGRLLKVVVTTVFAGTSGVLTFYDNASAASGTVLMSILQASGTVGSVFTLDLPAANGIFVGVSSGSLSGGAVTVGFS